MVTPRESTLIRRLVGMGAARWGPGAAFVIAVLVIWELVVRTVGIRHSTLPSPTRVILQIWREAPQLQTHSLVTGLEAMEGLVLSVLIGFPLASLATVSIRVRRLTAPFMSLGQSLPLISLAPLVMIWFGLGIPAAAALSFMVCLLPFTAGLQAGFDSVPHEAVEIAKAMGASPARLFLQICLPACRPATLGSIKLCLPLALAGATVAEFIGSGRGLGYLMLYASATVDTTQLMAVLTVLFLMAIGFHLVVDFVERAWIYRPAKMPERANPARKMREMP